MAGCQPRSASGIARPFRTAPLRFLSPRPYSTSTPAARSNWIQTCWAVQKPLLPQR